MASIAAGSVYGVAKGALIYGVKVLDCSGSGTIFTVLAGLDMVASQRSPTRSTIINLSLNAPSDSALNDEVSALVLESGIAVVVAAGNSHADACRYSPSGAPNVLTVTATDENDSLATDFANYGNCVPLAAPGVNTIAAWGTSDTAVASTTGTSMASPQVAGDVALEWEFIPNKLDAVAAINAVLTRATRNIVTHVPSGPVPALLYSRQAAGALPPPPPPPGGNSIPGLPPNPPPQPPPNLVDNPVDSAPVNNGTKDTPEFQPLVAIVTSLGLFLWLQVM